MPFFLLKVFEVNQEDKLTNDIYSININHISENYLSYKHFVTHFLSLTNLDLVLIQNAVHISLNSQFTKQFGNVFSPEFIHRLLFS